MSNPTDHIKQECKEAEDAWATAEVLQALAVEAVAKHPTRENEVALKAARRLVKESKARLEEWTLGGGEDDRPD